MGQAGVNGLAQVISRLDVQRDADHRAKRPKVDDRSREHPGICLARQPQHISACCHDLHPGHRRRQIPDGRARAMRGRHHRPGHRDMRQRGKIGQRPALGLQAPRQIGIADAPANRHPPQHGVEGQDTAQVLQRQVHAFRIGDVAETVPRPQHLHALAGRDNLLHLGHRAGPAKPRGIVPQVSAPVRPHPIHSRCDPGQPAPCDGYRQLCATRRARSAARRRLPGRRIFRRGRGLVPAGRCRPLAPAMPDSPDWRKPGPERSFPFASPVRCPGVVSHRRKGPNSPPALADRS